MHELSMHTVTIENGFAVCVVTCSHILLSMVISMVTLNAFGAKVSAHISQRKETCCYGNMSDYTLLFINACSVTLNTVAVIIVFIIYNCGSTVTAVVYTHEPQMST